MAVRSGFVEGQRGEVAIVLPERGEAASLVAGAASGPDPTRDETGLAIDGREGLLRAIRWEIVHDPRIGTFADFVAAVWGRFSTEAALGRTAESSTTYTVETVEHRCRADWAKRERGDIKPRSRKPRPGVGPSYPLAPIPAAEATRQLDEICRTYFASPSDAGVRITSGAGKTTVVATLLANELPPGEVAHVFVRELELAHDLAALIGKANPARRVRIVEGRSAENCARHELTKVISDAGLPVQTMACDPGGVDDDPERAPVPFPGERRGRCPHFATCPYQRQFREEEAEVYIFAHQHIFLKKRAEIPAPDFIIVDESFFAGVVGEKEIEAGTILADALWIESGHEGADFARVVLRLLEDKAPLLKGLRAAGYDAARVDAIRAAIAGMWRPQFRDLNPALDVEVLLGRAKGFRPLPDTYRLARELAVELATDADDSTAVCLGQNEKKRAVVRVWWAKDHRLNVPTLFLDATADKAILEKFRPDTGRAFHTLDVERKAVVTQITDSRLAKRALTTDKSAESNVRRLRAARGRIEGRHRTGVAVTHKPLRDTLTTGPGWEPAHYGAVRGKDGWKGLEAVSLSGRPMPPRWAIEGQARVLARMAGKEGVPGEWTEEWRGIGMRDGTAVEVLADCHTNPLVEACRWQAVEAELLQAMDRLRLVHRVEPGRVYLLTSVPLPIIVDTVTTLDDVAGGSKIEVLAARFGVVVRSPTWLAGHAPDLFPDREAAKWWLRSGKATRGGNGLREYKAVPPSAPPGFVGGSYRTEAQAGGKSVRFWVPADHPAPRATLEALVGPLSLYEPPPPRRQPLR